MENDQRDDIKPLIIIEFQVNNFKGAKAIRIIPDGPGIVKILGKNGQGKSSAIEAMCSALYGKSYVPNVPLAEGSKKASVKLNFGEFTVRRNFTEKGTTLIVETPDGMSPKSIQGFLTSRLGGLAFNPLKFMDLSPMEQLAVIQKICPLTLDRDKIRFIVGNWSDKIKGDDPAILLDHLYKLVFEDRADSNKDITRLKGAIESILILKEDENLKEIFVDEYLEKKKKFDEVLLINNKLRKQASNLDLFIKGKKKDILQIEDKICRIEVELAKLKQDLDAQNSYLQELFQQEQNIKQEVDFLKDPDYTEIEEDLKKSSAHNKKVAEIFLLKKDQKQKQKKFDEEIKRSQKFTDTLQSIKDYKVELIKKAGLPLPDMGIEDGKLTYNGRPISMMCTSEQIKLCCAICLKEHPQIGILLMDRGWSDLDKKSQMVLEEFALISRIQIWITKVQENPNGEGFYIVDGGVKYVDGESVEEDCEEE